MKRFTKWGIAAGVCTILIAVSLCFGYYRFKNSVPDVIYLEHKNELSEALPKGVTYEKSIETSSNGGFVLSCNLFNTIPLKNVKVQMVEEQWVKASGEPIGIYMETSGLLVIDTEQIKNLYGQMEEPAKNILKAGDYIISINDEKITHKEDLVAVLKESSGSPLNLGVLRNHEEIKVSIPPIQTKDGSYKLGVWIRDDVQGIGTLTYVKDDGTFGALGHGISDIDTATMLALEEGFLYKTQILSVKKGAKGNPGELTGIINYVQDNQLGTIIANTDQGIFGKLYDETLNNISQKSYQVALKQEIVEGPAQILCCVDGEVDSYNATIEKINYNSKEPNKSFVIHITDERLLEKTGGIVQGMSGSPIIQNDKIIGAVTHVFVQDATSGYGIFIENMLNKCPS